MTKYCQYVTGRLPIRDNKETTGEFYSLTGVSLIKMCLLDIFCPQTCYAFVQVHTFSLSFLAF